MTDNFKLLHDTHSEMNGNWGLLQRPDSQEAQSYWHNCRQVYIALFECTEIIIWRT